MNIKFFNNPLLRSPFYLKLNYCSLCGIVVFSSNCVRVSTNTGQRRKGRLRKECTRQQVVILHSSFVVGVGIVAVFFVAVVGNSTDLILIHKQMATPSFVGLP